MNLYILASNEVFIGLLERIKMRLIDANLWVDKLNKSFIAVNYHPDLGDAFQCMEAEKRNEDIADLIMEINNQPTVYINDLDKFTSRLSKEVYSGILNQNRLV